MNCAGLEAKISLGGRKSTFNYKLIYHAGWMRRWFAAKIPTLGFLYSFTLSSIPTTRGHSASGVISSDSPGLVGYVGYPAWLRVCTAALSVRQSTRVDEFTRQSEALLCQAWGNVYVITRQEAAENVFNKEVQWKVGDMWFLKNLYHLIWNIISILDTRSWLISKGIIRFLLLRQKSPSLPILNGVVWAAPTVYSESAEGKNSLNL